MVPFPPWPNDGLLQLYSFVSGIDPHFHAHYGHIKESKTKKLQGKVGSQQ